MTNQELIERYVYAVSNWLPPKMREDVMAELKSLINDTLKERFGEVIPTEKDVKLLLTELGPPHKLSMKYHPYKDKYLIGPDYYIHYIQTLKTLLIGATSGHFLSAVISTAARGMQEPWYYFLPGWIESFVWYMLISFTTATVMFAIIQRKNLNIWSSTSDINNLPPVRNNKMKIGGRKSILGIIFLTIFSLVFLIYPELIAIYNIKDGTLQRITPIFNIEVLRRLWYIVIIIFILSFIKEFLKIIERRYTKRIAIVTGIANILTIVLSCVFVMNNIINPDLIEHAKLLLDSDRSFLMILINESPIILFAIISFILVIDFIAVLIKTENQA